MLRRSLSPMLAVGVLTCSAAAFGDVAKGPWVQRVTPTSAVVRFELDAAGPATLELGLEGPAMRDGGTRVLESATPTKLHSITITGLEPGTRYPYEVRSPGGTKYAALVTAPKEDSTAPFRFLIYGDTRTDEAAHAAVVRGMATQKADFLVHTGDFVGDGASLPEWQTFFDVEAPLLRVHPIYSAVGNHEVTDGKGLEYVRYFGPTDAIPELGANKLRPPEHMNGTFRWANARFFLMNGMVGWRSGADRAWLEKALSDSDAEPGLVWRIVVVHHGPWSSGPHGDNVRLQEAGIPQLFRSHKIDLVIAGHDHDYERGWADGMAYVVSGGGGAPVYAIKKPRPSARRYEAAHHFIEASVSAAAINFATMRPDGSVIERCALRKDSGWDCDAAASSSNATSVTSAESTTTASRCGCRAVGSRSALGGGGLALATAMAAAFVRRRRRAILGACAAPSRRSPS